MFKSRELLYFCQSGRERRSSGPKAAQEQELKPLVESEEAWQKEKEKSELVTRLGWRIIHVSRVLIRSAGQYCSCLPSPHLSHRAA